MGRPLVSVTGVTLVCEEVTSLKPLVTLLFPQTYSDRASPYETQAGKLIPTVDEIINPLWLIILIMYYYSEL